MVNVKNLMMLVHLITESQYTGLHSLKSILKILDIFFDDVFHDSTYALLIHGSF